jgi:hypothetical protein
MFKHLLVLLLLFSTTAQAELDELYKQAIKVPNPNELSLYSAVAGGCKAMSQSELRSIAEGVFIRSRIKALPFGAHGNSTKYPIFLSVFLKCFGETPYLFDLDIEFRRSEPKPRVAVGYSYGTYGSGPTAGIKNAVKEEVERAITDYVKVNFNL